MYIRHKPGITAIIYLHSYVQIWSVQARYNVVQLFLLLESCSMSYPTITLKTLASVLDNTQTRHYTNLNKTLRVVADILPHEKQSEIYTYAQKP